MSANINAITRTGSGYESYGNMLGPPINTMRVPINCYLNKFMIEDARDGIRKGLMPLYQMGTARKPHDALPDSLLFVSKNSATSGATSGLLAGISTLNGFGNNGDDYLQVQDEFFLAGKVGSDGAYFSGVEETDVKRNSLHVAVETSGPVQLQNRGRERINPGDILMWGFPNPEHAIVDKSTGHIYPEIYPYRPVLEKSIVQRLRETLSDPEEYGRVLSKQKKSHLEEGAEELFDFIKFWFAAGAHFNAQVNTGDTFGDTLKIVTDNPTIIHNIIGDSPIQGGMENFTRERKILIPNVANAIKSIFHDMDRRKFGTAIDAAPQYGDFMYVVLGSLAL